MGNAGLGSWPGAVNWLGVGGPRPLPWALGVPRGLADREVRVTGKLKTAEAESCALSQVGGGDLAAAGGAHADVHGSGPWKACFKESQKCSCF